MKMAELQPGDIVLVGIRGDQFEARFEGPIEGWDGHYRIKPLVPGRGYFSATAAQIVRPVPSEEKAA